MARPIALIGVPTDRFVATVREYQPRSLVSECPGVCPGWVDKLVASGCTMDFERLVIQAGRHFADSLNLAVVPNSTTRRQDATRLAWVLLAMLQPTVANRRLEVVEIPDSDIARLTSEIIGVGACLELLRSSGIIDARTLQKETRFGRFDYTATGRNGAGSIAIEAKGTFRERSLQGHRQSFKGKLKAEGLLRKASGRGYSRAIGVIFSTWCAGLPRREDFELLDPEGEEDDCFESAVRRTIRFYARRYDEIAGIKRAAESLWRLAVFPQLFDKSAPLTDFLGSSPKLPGRFSRISLTLRHEGHEQVFWGTVWDASVMPYPFRLPEDAKETGLPIAYTGIDRRVIDFLRIRDFKSLLALDCVEGLYALSAKSEKIGRILTDGFGVVQGWFSKFPSLQHDVEFVADLS